MQAVIAVAKAVVENDPTREKAKVALLNAATLQQLNVDHLNWEEFRLQVLILFQSGLRRRLEDVHTEVFCGTS